MIKNFQTAIKKIQTKKSGKISLADKWKNTSEKLKKNTTKIVEKYYSDTFL